ncbi:MAG: helix-turn-helix transcriptional regulator [Pirellulaceae bacterium]
MATIHKPNNSDSAFQDAISDPVTIALAVLVDRIKTLPKDDREDLYELSHIVFSSESEEERQSAANAMREILRQESGKASELELPSDPEGELSGWLEWISGRILEARKSAGLTQEQLAENAGLTQSHISRLEAKQHSPSSTTIEKIAKALDLSPSHFDPSAE